MQSSLQPEPDPGGAHGTARRWATRTGSRVRSARRPRRPGEIHVSASCNPNLHHQLAYLGSDTTAFVQLMMSDVFTRDPQLRSILPHGGGAVPYHWGRFRGLANDMNLPPLDELVLDNVYFDTCLYHQPGIDLLLKVIPNRNVLFGSEMIGAVRGVDPLDGRYFDDTRRYVDAAAITGDERNAIYDANIRGSTAASGTDCVIPAVDVDHRSRRRREPIAQQRHHAASDGRRIGDIQPRGARSSQMSSNFLNPDALGRHGLHGPAAIRFDRMPRGPSSRAR